MSRVPHPIPYQGSKRRLAAVILKHAPTRVKCLFEPFAGSAATTLAAAARGLAYHYVIGDSLKPLAAIWEQTICAPRDLIEAYASLWNGQHENPRRHFNLVREQFNRERKPAQLLYLLARCVKNAVRFNPSGNFNQSADHRRSGMNPLKMREEIKGASALLANKTEVFAGDYEVLLHRAQPSDLVYMDPPYQGVSDTGDPRYYQQLDFDRLMANLDALNSRGVPFLLSFDGSCGSRTYGKPLPAELHVSQILIHTGKSSQATLNREDAETVESLYVSPSLLPRGERYFSVATGPNNRQLRLL
ncbi:MAG: DNA adenine methylase [Bryobacteraceae bacterium]